MHSIRSGYRWFTTRWWEHWLDPRTYWYWAKYKIQRANRGWADCDIWSLDWYLSSWLPDALRRLKDTKHGTPFSVFPEEQEFIDETGNPTEQACEIAKKRWDEVLCKMIAGFEAFVRIGDSPTSYEPEIGEFPHVEWKCIPTENGTVRLLFTEEEDRAIDEWRARESPLIARDQKIWEEGAALFIKHFGSLWD
jgi:hypothetical protein